MKVKKIMNWPLTIFTLLAMIAISVYGMRIGMEAFLSEFAQEHVEYDLALDTLSTRMSQNIDNRTKNVKGITDIIASGVCDSERELMQVLDSVVSGGEWDAYGYMGKVGMIKSTQGRLLEISRDKGYGKQILEEKNVFWGTSAQKSYLMFCSDVKLQGEDTRLIFAVATSHLLEDAMKDSDFENNAAALMSPDGNIMAVHNLPENYDFNALQEKDYYNNLLGSTNSQLIDNIKKSYFDENMVIIFEDGDKNITLTPSITEDDEYQVDVQGSSNDNEFQKLSENTTIRLDEGYLWFRKDIKCNEAGVITLLSGKTKVISPDMLQQTSNITGVFVFGIFLLAIVFLMQIAFTVHSNKKLVKVAYIDPITKNRNWNRFSLDAAKLLRKRKQRKYAMAVFDIDKFNVYNDLYSHNEGNILLYQVAKYFHDHLGKKEIVTRCGADHFTLLLIWDTEEELDARLLKMKYELTEKFAKRSVKFTVGTCKIIDYSQSIDKLYTFTSLAQENAKQHRDLPIAYFSDEQRQHLLHEKELENSMEEALKDEEFTVYLQPKYFTDGSKIGGAEALVRWNSKKLGFISPGDFIPLFEKNGFVIKLDNYMLDHVCALQKKWQKEGKQLITISVNVSRIHLMDPNLVNDVIRIVDSYKLPHSCIELELTESAFFDAKEVLISTIKRFREAGFEVSMDDFGSGYSSLNSLKDLPLDVIKLDGEFFKETEDKERGSRIVMDTIHLAKHLNMRIVAEGIEKKEQVDFLKDSGCDLIQGFYFARPMPVEDFVKIWTNGEQIEDN